MTSLNAQVEELARMETPIAVAATTIDSKRGAIRQRAYRAPAR